MMFLFFSFRSCDLPSRFSLSLARVVHCLATFENINEKKQSNVVDAMNQCVILSHMSIIDEDIEYF